MIHGHSLEARNSPFEPRFRVTALTIDGKGSMVAQARSRSGFPKNPHIPHPTFDLESAKLGGGKLGLLAFGEELFQLIQACQATGNGENRLCLYPTMAFTLRDLVEFIEILRFE